MSQTVMVCDDEGLTTLRLERALSALGYDVVARASSGLQAIELAQQRQPDLILMDVNMPGMDGIEALRQIMRDSPTAAVMLTAYADPETVHRALDAGASGYLIKPIRDDQLVPALTVAQARFEELRQERLAASAAQAESERKIHTGLRRVAELGRALRDEHSLARSLAESFLGPTPSGIPGLLIQTVYEPACAAELVGGDFFDFISLGDRYLGIAIADVCGKGLPAAALTAVTRHMLRAYAVDDPSPDVVLHRLNRALCFETSEERAFVTLFYGVLDLETFHLVYANGGHPLPLIWSPGSGPCASLPSTGGVLGLEPGWSWAAGEAEIAPGGALALMTDGIEEARRDGELFGTDRVNAELSKLLREDSENPASDLKERAKAFAGGALKDDVAVIVLRRLREPVATKNASG